MNTVQKLSYAIKKLKQSGIPLVGGNCGRVALALYKYVSDKKVLFAIATNVEEETDLLEEPDIYHVFLLRGSKSRDGTGNISRDDMAAWIESEYGDPNPNIFTFNHTEVDKVYNIVRRETNWTTEWQEFYQLL